MHLFYTDRREEQHIYLHDQEAQHCTRVMRKSIGDQIMALDGKGRQYTAIIEEVSKGLVRAVIDEEIIYESDLKMPHLAFGIIKHPARIEWLIEKVTEVGVHRITPLICTRSEKRNIKKARLEKIIISAAKQSKAFHFPILDDPMTCQEFLESHKDPGYIASWGPEVPELQSITERPSQPCLIIGPEGDFTDQELSTFVNNGYQRVSLGTKRLRTETACVVGCAALMMG